MRCNRQKWLVPVLVVLFAACTGAEQDTVTPVDGVDQGKATTGLPIATGTGDKAPSGKQALPYPSWGCVSTKERVVLDILIQYKVQNWEEFL